MKMAVGEGDSVVVHMMVQQDDFTFVGSLGLVDERDADGLPDLYTGNILFKDGECGVNIVWIDEFEEHILRLHIFADVDIDFRDKAMDG